MPVIPILNPARKKGKTSPKKGGLMATKKKKSRVSKAPRKVKAIAKRRKAVRKVARKAVRRVARKRRAVSGKMHRPRVYSHGGKWYRSPQSPLVPARTLLNPRKRRKSRRYRRNPFNLSTGKSMLKQYANKDRLLGAVGIVAGLGASALTKNMTAKIINSSKYARVYGILSIIAGTTMTLKAKQPFIRSMGTGFVAYGILDLVVANVPALAKFFPTIAAPTLSGYQSYGRNVMGADIPSNGAVEVVGSNLNFANPEFEIVGDDMDLADALEMNS